MVQTKSKGKCKGKSSPSTQAPQPRAGISCEGPEEEWPSLVVLDSHSGPARAQEGGGPWELLDVPLYVPKVGVSVWLSAACHLPQRGSLTLICLPQCRNVFTRGFSYLLPGSGGTRSLSPLAPGRL